MEICKLITAALLTLVIWTSGYRDIGASASDVTASLNAISNVAERSAWSSITKLPNYQITKFLQIPRPVPEKEAPDQLPQAEANLQSRHYDVAEGQLQALTKSQPKNPQVWFDLGFAESHLSKNDEAIAAYRKTVDLSPKWFEANLNLGLALAKANNLSDAAAALRSATELKPTTGGQQALGNAWFSLAQVLEESAPKESLSAFQKAEELTPANADAVLGAGKLMEAQGDAAGAEKQYLTAVQIGNTGALERLLNLYLKQKRFADAESWLQKYVAANPNNVAAQAQLGKILAAEGKTQDAIAALEAANKNTPDPAVSRELASLYIEAKQYDAAAPLLQELLQKNPSDGQLHCDLGNVLLHQHKYPEAEAELLQGLKISPKQDDAYWELAYAAQQDKHYELAIRALDARAQRLPETATTYWIRAVSYDSLGAFKPAAENYKLFLAVDGGKSPDEEFKARHRLKAIQH